MSSITGLARRQTDAWAEELRRSDQWLKRAKQRELVAFLNRRDTLCTPGFLLRRQIQEQFPHLMREAEGRCGLLPGDYPDLTKAGNVPWPEALTRSLAKVLSETVFPGYGAGRPGIDSRQWQSYLDEGSMCNRSTAIKLIFALEMDDAAAAKFLLSNGRDLLSVRHPVDFICKYCLEHTPRLPYEKAMELASQFEARRSGALDGAGRGKNAGDTAPSFGYGMTTELDGMLRDLLDGADGLPEDTRAERLIGYMVEHEREFSPKYQKKNQKHRLGEPQYEYASGFSLQNIRMLKVLLKYLAILYPASVGLDSEDRAVNIPVETDDQGVPRVYSHLTQAMFQLQDIDLPEHGELNVPAKGKEKLAYDQIPFNENIVLPLKNLSAALRAMVRAEDNPANAKDVNRSTVLLLAYFFITGFQYVPPRGIPAPAEGIERQLEADLTRADDPGEARILHALLDMTDLLYDTEGDPAGAYLACLNRLLACFHFGGFYPPFVLDRFVFLCLLADPMNAAMGADDALQYMMQLVISESFRLRREER